MQKLLWLLPVLFGLFSLASCWNMALHFWRAWWYPLINDNGTWIKYGVGIMVMEFIVVHSGGLLTGVASAAKKFRWLFLSLLVLLYFGFAGLISFMFDSLPLFNSFASIMFCRLITGFFSVNENNAESAIQRSVTNGMLYLVVAILSTSIPYPEGGVTGRVRNQFYPVDGTGAWQKEPQRALAAGVIYFGSMGLFELHAAHQTLKRFFEMRKSHLQFYGK